MKRPQMVRVYTNSSWMDYSKIAHVVINARFNMGGGRGAQALAIVGPGAAGGLDSVARKSHFGRRYLRRTARFFSSALPHGCDSTVRTEMQAGKFGR